MFQKQQSNFCEILTKAHMLESLFKKLQTLRLFLIQTYTVLRLFLIFLNDFCKNVKNTFLQDSSRRPLLIFRKPHIFKHLILSKFIHSINIVHTLYLMNRNVNFRTSILQLSYYKNNFQPEKFSLDICQYKNL